jgi:hypothetical protein
MFFISTYSFYPQLRKAFETLEALSSLRDVFQDEILSLNREKSRLGGYL